MPHGLRAITTNLFQDRPCLAGQADRNQHRQTVLTGKPLHDAPVKGMLVDTNLVPCDLNLSADRRGI
jgi:hypothetical protein